MEEVMEHEVFGVFFFSGSSGGQRRDKRHVELLLSSRHWKTGFQIRNEGANPTSQTRRVVQKQGNPIPSSRYRERQPEGRSLGSFQVPSCAVVLAFVLVLVPVLLVW